MKIKSIIGVTEIDGNNKTDRMIIIMYINEEYTNGKYLKITTSVGMIKKKTIINH